MGLIIYRKGWPIRCESMSAELLARGNQHIGEKAALEEAGRWLEASGLPHGVGGGVSPVSAAAKNDFVICQLYLNTPGGWIGL